MVCNAARRWLLNGKVFHVSNRGLEIQPCFYLHPRKGLYESQEAVNLIKSMIYFEACRPVFPDCSMGIRSHQNIYLTGFS